MSAGDEIIGYEVAAVEEWIRDNTQGLEPPFEWTRLEGGHSNLTYSLKDQNGNAAVVRRPPMGELLPKAHDMGREFSIISGLGPTAVGYFIQGERPHSRPPSAPAKAGRCTLAAGAGALCFAGVCGLGAGMGERPGHQVDCGR